MRGIQVAMRSVPVQMLRKEFIKMAFLTLFYFAKIAFGLGGEQIGEPLNIAFKENEFESNMHEMIDASYLLGWA